MRKTLIASLTALCLAAAPAYADHDRYHDRYRDRHDHGSPWVGLAIVGAIAGLAMIANSDRERPRAPAPVYVEPTNSLPYSAPYSPPPPPPVAAMPSAPAPTAPGTLYYCGSSNMYYPNTRACPEGWQAVAPSPY